MIESKGTGDNFQRETKYVRDGILRDQSAPVVRPDPCKEYPQSEKINLGEPGIDQSLSLWETINLRRSERHFNKEPLSRAELTQLLHACQGITFRARDFAFRAAPSAGALYPVETYLLINNVEEIEQGIYHYGVERRQLEVIRKGHFGAQLGAAALDQQMIRSAAVVFIWTAVVDRCKWKYGQRAFRYIYLDAGHIAQNAALAAVSLGLGSCAIAAFYDDEMNNLIEVDGENETAIYLTAVGKPRRV